MIKKCIQGIGHVKIAVLQLHLFLLNQRTPQQSHAENVTARTNQLEVVELAFSGFIVVIGNVASVMLLLTSYRLSHWIRKQLHVAIVIQKINKHPGVFYFLFFQLIKSLGIIKI
jgi:precorrin isomerase